MKGRTLLLPGNSVLKQIIVASALALFGCYGDPSGPDFRVTVEGFVLEYVDATRTTTRPVDGALVEVLLPDGQTRQWCFPLSGFCGTREWASQSLTGPDGHYVLIIGEPDDCGLRVRADGGGGQIATAPRVAPGCRNGGTYDGPTLIIE